MVKFADYGSEKHLDLPAGYYFYYLEIADSNSMCTAVHVPVRCVHPVIFLLMVMRTAAHVRMRCEYQEITFGHAFGGSLGRARGTATTA